VNKELNEIINHANKVSLKSNDPKTKVGAVIYDDEYTILSAGYNKISTDDKDILNSKEKHNYVIHAEMDALLELFSLIPLPEQYEAIESGKGFNIYITRSPCIACVNVLARYKFINKIFYGYEHKAAKNVYDELSKKYGIEINKV